MYHACVVENIFFLSVADKDNALAEKMKQVLADNLKERYVDNRIKSVL